MDPEDAWRLRIRLVVKERLEQRSNDSPSRAAGPAPLLRAMAAEPPSSYIGVHSVGGSFECHIPLPRQVQTRRLCALPSLEQAAAAYNAAMMALARRGDAAADSSMFNVVPRGDFGLGMAPLGVFEREARERVTMALGTLLRAANALPDPHEAALAGAIYFEARRTNAIPAASRRMGLLGSALAARDLLHPCP